MNMVDFGMDPQEAGDAPRPSSERQYSEGDLRVCQQTVAAYSIRTWLQSVVERQLMRMRHRLGSDSPMVAIRHSGMLKVVTTLALPKAATKVRR